MVWHITGKIPLSYHKGQLMPISVDKVYSILNNHLLPIWHQAIFHYNAASWLLIEAAGLAVSPCPTAQGKENYQSGKWIRTDFSSLFHISR